MGAPLRASNKLVDFLVSSRGLKNDAELARKLDFKPPAISKIRGGGVVSAEVILRIHEKLDVPVRDIRALLKD